MYPDQIFKKVASRIKIKNTPGTIIYHIALLKRIFDKEGFMTDVIKGFCYVHDTGELCDHYWLEDPSTGLNFDIGFEVAKLKNPELETLQIALLGKAPDGIIPIDKDEVVIRHENERLYKLLKEDPVKFWKLAPAEVKSFKI